MKRAHLMAVATLALVVLAVNATGVVGIGGRSWLPILSDQKLIPSPEEYFGYSIGDNYRLTYWSDEVSYLRLVANLSDRVEVAEIGRTSGGRPIVLVVVSSPDNLARLEYYRDIARKLSDPRTVHVDDAVQLARAGKPIVFLMGDQHSNEVDHSEAVMQFVYELATRNDAKTVDILNNVIIVFLPSANPDGHDVYRDWYYTYSKTAYAGTTPPVYGVPVSHDNNRDWYALNLYETQVITSSILYWRPQILVDNHQMGSYGYRMFVPPEMDPINPNVNPLIQQLKFMAGGAVVTGLQANGHHGVTSLQVYDLFYPGYTDSSWSLRNIVSMTWEIARSNGADPIYIQPSELSSAAKTQATYHMQPWEGGWWTLRDQVNYRITAWWSLLENVALNRFQYLYYTYLAAKDNVERGMNEPPYAFLIPPYSRDPAYLCEMINKLIQLGIEVRQLRTSFFYDGVTYQAGTYVILMNQPNRGFAKTLLETQVLGIEYFYDVTAWSYGLMWNLPVVQVNSKEILSVSVSAPLSTCTPPKGSVTGTATYAYVFNHTLTGIKAVNDLLRDGLWVYFHAGASTKVDGVTLESGAVVVPVLNAKTLTYSYMNSLAEKFGLKIYAVNATLKVPLYEIRGEPQIALYAPQRSGTQSMNAGWIKIILGRYNFKYDVISDNNITTVDLSKYNAIIIPDESPATRIVTGITGYPLKNGIGTDGLAKLRKFVEDGGVLVLLNRAGSLPITYEMTTEVKLADMTGVSLPGTIVRAYVNTTHFLGYGLTPEIGVFVLSSPAFIAPSKYVVSRYPDTSDKVWLSGFIKGQGALAGKASLLDLQLGKGRLVMFGFDPTYRAQSSGTFLFVFNAIYYGLARLK